ncbi:MAG: hypothetical protein E7442_07830 [Ruminococcaceae bacterium]|nr:hypothetical protein [Oscillospiraceae bacterium]
MNEINVEKIMNEIRAQIPEQESGWAALRFEDIPMENSGEEVSAAAFDKRDFEKSVTALAASEQVEYFRPIPGGKVKSFTKRIVRKLIRFCVEPICQEVSAFHGLLLRAFQELRRFVAETAAQNRRRDAELELLRRETEELRARLDELERRV